MEALTRMECMKLLLTCMDLFQPENCGYYARFSPEGKISMELAREIPAGFPQDKAYMHDLSAHIYNSMCHIGLHAGTGFSVNPEILKEQADSLPFEGCARFLLHLNRAHCHGAEEMFYRMWHEGTILRVLRRMQSQIGDYLFPDERSESSEIMGIEMMLGDITTTEVDAVVNPTDTEFSGSGGVDRLIHKAAGPELWEACKKAGKLFVGSAAQTASFGLPAKHIIHVAVPRFGHPGGPYLLASCYANALELANHSDIRTIAFPTMGTGSTGIPVREALRIGAQTLWSWKWRNLDRPLRVRILFNSPEKLVMFRRELMLCLVREFRAMVDPVDMGLKMLHSLPCILDEYGGMATLPPEQKQVADIGREAFYELHGWYGHLATELYRMIGCPQYGTVYREAVKRVASAGLKDDEAFLANLDEMSLRECICWLVLQSRLDYGSGVTDHDQIRNCSNGNAYRVLGRMEKLLRVE